MERQGIAEQPPAADCLQRPLRSRFRQRLRRRRSIGFGRSDAADGRVFPYVFTAPATYWSQNTAKLRFIGQRAGGMEQLKGLKIVHVYHDSDYGRETLPILDQQAVRYGFAVQHLPVQPPGLDQKATWLRVTVAQPDWVILGSAGIMTMAALKEAAQVGFPRDKIVGTHPTCAEQEMVLAGEAAIGVICANWYGTGTHFPLIQEVLSSTSMPGARGRGRNGMSAHHFGSGVCCAPCSRRRGSARPCATSGTSP